MWAAVCTDLAMTGSMVVAWSLLAGRWLSRWPGTRRWRSSRLVLRTTDFGLIICVLIAAHTIVRLAVATACANEAVVQPDAQQHRARFLTTAVHHIIVFLATPMVLWSATAVPPYQLGLHARRLRSAVFFGIAQTLVWWPLTAWVARAVRLLLPRSEIHPAESFLRSEHVLWDWALVVACVVICAPLAEELLFRGLLQSWLSRIAGGKAAVAGTAVVFGLVHSQFWPDPIPLFIFGIGLGETYERTRSLAAPIALHAAFNAVMLSIGFIQSQ